MKILMVCLGNICRSPLAEGIMRENINKHQLDWEVDSAGTGSWHTEELPDPRSIAVALQHQIDISHQRARQFRPDDLDFFDLIFAMDSSNYQNIINLAQNEAQKSKVQLIMNMLTPELNQAVPDPYYGGEDGFEKVFQMLDQACKAIVERHA